MLSVDNAVPARVVDETFEVREEWRTSLSECGKDLMEHTPFPVIVVLREWLPDALDSLPPNRRLILC